MFQAAGRRLQPAGLRHHPNQPADSPSPSGHANSSRPISTLSRLEVVAFLLESCLHSPMHLLEPPLLSFESLTAHTSYALRHRRCDKSALGVRPARLQAPRSKPNACIASDMVGFTLRLVLLLALGGFQVPRTAAASVSTPRSAQWADVPDKLDLPGTHHRVAATLAAKVRPPHPAPLSCPSTPQPLLPVASKESETVAPSCARWGDMWRRRRPKRSGSARAPSYPSPLILPCAGCFRSGRFRRLPG